MWRVALLILLLTSVVYAQPDPHKLDLYKSDFTSPPKFNLHQPYFTSNLSIPYKQNILDTIDPYSIYRTPGAIKIRYVGIHKMVFSQMNKRIKAQGRSNLRRMYNTGMIGDKEFRQNMKSLEHTMEEQWYNRPWYHSLPPEKGGAPKNPIEIEVGWKIHFETLPIISWFHEQIKKLGDIWIEHDHYYDGQEDGPGLIRPDRSQDASQNDHDKFKIGNPLPDIIVTRNRWYQGTTYHLRFKPSVRFKPTQGTNRIIDEVSLKVLVELYHNNHNKSHFANLVFFISHNIPQNDTILTVALSFINF